MLKKRFIIDAAGVLFIAVNAFFVFLNKGGGSGDS